MKPWMNLSAAVLATSLLVACGGDGGGADEGAVKPLSQLQPGERFAMETPLLAGGSQISHYVVHGVTPKGELVDSDRPGLVEGVRLSILESVTRDGQSSASAAHPTLMQPQFVNPVTLKQQQQAFYQQLWDALAEHEGTRDPQVILAEIDDLDARIVDLMDDVAASGVTLREYIAFYDRLDSMPGLADKTLAELNLREALSDVDKYSLFEANPPACPAGLARVVSQSGLSSYCRVPSTRKTAQVDPRAKTGLVIDSLTEPNVKGLLDAASTNEQLKDLIYRIQTEHRLRALDSIINTQAAMIQLANQRIVALNQALSENGQDDQRWKTYCAQHPELECVVANAPGFGAATANTVKRRLDELNASVQLGMIAMQSLISRRDEAYELTSTFLRKLQDPKTAIVSNMR